MLLEFSSTYRREKNVELVGNAASFSHHLPKFASSTIRGCHTQCPLLCILACVDFSYRLDLVNTLPLYSIFIAHTKQ